MIEIQEGNVQLRCFLMSPQSADTSKERILSLDARRSIDMSELSIPAQSVSVLKRSAAIRMLRLSVSQRF